MKKVLIALAAFFILTSCTHITGSGNIITEKRQVGSFEAISAGGAFEVELQQGDVQSVTVESDDNIMPYIETKVSGNELKISNKRNSNFNNGHYKVFVTVPELNKIECSGAANVKAKGLLKNNSSITIKTSGAADIVAEVDAPEIIVKASGAGNIKLSGRTKNYTAVSSGSADIKTINLQSENTDVTVSGAGNAHVHASVSLKAEASGAGSIFYTGSARVDQRVSGAGSVRREE
jgi:hypothetical protein